ncbi:zeta toxin family protein [Nocardia sp. NPDC049220]|uniref:zeta toxin family protein n=1 Tax=Nocardia sp. NPDC049220 TaxID=3155273 RepID=UPI0033FE44CD
MTSSEPGHHRYSLSTEQAEYIFRTQIEPQLLRSAAPQNSPIATVFIGQRGAGQAAFATSVAHHEFADHTRPVVINADLFSRFHPDFRRLTLTEIGGAVTARQKVAADACRWLEMTVAEAARRRLNVIVSGEFATRDELNAVLTSLAFTPAGAKPYRIEAALMAVHPAESWLGWLATYQQGYEDFGAGWEVEPDRLAHNASDRHMLTVADWLDTDERISVIGVYRREAIPRDSGGWDLFPYADHYRSADPSRPTREVLEAVRRLPWSYNYSVMWGELYSRLAIRMRPEWTDALNQARHDARGDVIHDAVELPDPTFDPLAIRIHRPEIVVFDDFHAVTAVDLAVVTELAFRYAHVEIAVVDETARPESVKVWPTDNLLDFYAERQQAAAQDWLPADERAAMWRTALAAKGISEARISVTVIPPPEFNWTRFTKDNPVTRFHIGMITNDSDHADRRRNSHYQTILNRRITAVSTPAPRPGIADVARMYQEGDPTWPDLLAPGAATAIPPDRMFGPVISQLPPIDRDGLWAAARGCPHHLNSATNTPDTDIPCNSQPPGNEVGGVGPAAGF